jgi:hypothetical protein
VVVNRPNIALDPGTLRNEPTLHPSRQHTNPVTQLMRTKWQTIYDRTL